MFYLLINVTLFEPVPFNHKATNAPYFGVFIYAYFRLINGLYSLAGLPNRDRSPKRLKKRQNVKNEVC